MTPAARTAERTFYAKRRRAQLVHLLAPDLRCAEPECGKQVEDACELQIDHVDGKAWQARKKTSHNRVARYWREYLAGVPMRVLCSSCNARDGAYKRHGIGFDGADEGVPF
jgi:hypothetical protein